jgi:hypothetical protein
MQEAEAIALARAVIANDVPSHVVAAKQLAEHVLAQHEAKIDRAAPMPSAADRVITAGASAPYLDVASPCPGRVVVDGDLLRCTRIEGRGHDGPCDFPSGLSSGVAPMPSVYDEIRRHATERCGCTDAEQCLHALNALTEGLVST